jgi:hypothetical protein
MNEKTVNFAIMPSAICILEFLIGFDQNINEIINVINNRMTRAISQANFFENNKKYSTPNAKNNDVMHK